MPRIIKDREKTLNEYLDIKALSGVSKSHLYETRRYLYHFLNYVNDKPDKSISVRYFNYLQDKLAVSSYRKTVYQILKFLRYMKIEWIDDIKLPPEPTYYPKYISHEDISKTIHFFQDNEYYSRMEAVILLGITSGIRAEELYQLELEDIDLQNRMLRINHNPTNGQSTKTKKSRISYFTEEAKQSLEQYINYFNDSSKLKVLFPQKWLERKFRETPIRVKYLRKFFSQEWDRRGGPTSIKKILMGHSLKGDVDLMHYNCQSEEDLKKIFDTIMY